MTEQVPASLTYEIKKLLVAERAPIDRSANLDGHGYTLPPWFVTIFANTALEDRRDMVTSGSQLLDEPRPCEGTSASEEDFHGNHLKSGSRLLAWHSATTSPGRQCFKA